MPFTYDIFISYAHLDDRSPFGDEKGWVDLLHERLSVLVSQALGSEVRIWRDGHVECLRIGVPLRIGHAIAFCPDGRVHDRDGGSGNHPTGRVPNRS